MPNAYDTVLYPGSPFAQTHPDRLAMLAMLFGMQPAPVTRCRVLEVGCADGANLIPMALSLPESEFTGIDLSVRPVTAGKAMIGELGLKNITLRTCDAMEVSPAWGKFDYIITHGLYSWVPPEVREQLFNISKTNLTAQGVAYISYNALPGGHMRRMIRDMILYHGRGIENPEERIRKARELLAFLVAAVPSKADEYRLFLKKELEQILERKPNLLFHDEMADTYEPVFFHQFITEASRHGLQFLSEANFFDMQDSAFKESVAGGLKTLSGADRIAREQYRDFLKCRKFRQTLLCHAELTLDAEPSPARTRNMYVGSPAKLVSNGREGVNRFEGQHGAAMQTAHLIANAAIMHLIKAWPRTLHFDELSASIGTEHSDALSEIVFTMFSAGLVELHAWQPRFRVTPGPRPIASPLARVQARSGSDLTTLRHSSVQVDGALERQLITLLDGSRDRQDLKTELALYWHGSDETVFETQLDENLKKVGLLALLME